MCIECLCVHVCAFCVLCVHMCVHVCVSCVCRVCMCVCMCMCAHIYACVCAYWCIVFMCVMCVCYVCVCHVCVVPLLTFPFCSSRSLIVLDAVCVSSLLQDNLNRQNQQLLIIRHNFKIAFFTELKQDLVGALRCVGSVRCVDVWGV